MSEFDFSLPTCAASEVLKQPGSKERVVDLPLSPAGSWWQADKRPGSCLLFFSVTKGRFFDNARKFERIIFHNEIASRSFFPSDLACLFGTFLWLYGVLAEKAVAPYVARDSTIR